jgi:hypothetical protein
MLPGGPTASENRGWRSDRHTGRSDPLPPRGSFIVCFTNHHHTPHGAHDSTRTMRGLGVHDSVRASRGIASPSSCIGDTSTASRSVVTTDEGRIGGTLGQPSSDNHVGEAGLLATGQQTHIVDYLIVTALTGAHLHPCRPHRPVLASCHA